MVNVPEHYHGTCLKTIMYYIVKIKNYGKCQNIHSITMVHAQKWQNIAKNTVLPWYMLKRHNW